MGGVSHDLTLGSRGDIGGSCSPSSWDCFLPRTNTRSPKGWPRGAAGDPHSVYCFLGDSRPEKPPQHSNSQCSVALTGPRLGGAQVCPPSVHPLSRDSGPPLLRSTPEGSVRSELLKPAPGQGLSEWVRCWVLSELQAASAAASPASLHPQPPLRPPRRRLAPRVTQVWRH